MDQKVNPHMVVMARESRGMTQEELAGYLKVTRPAVAYLENDYQTVNSTTMGKLCKALGYSESFFYQEGAAEPIPLNYRRRNIVSAKLMSQIDAIVNIFRLNIHKLLTAIGFKEPALPELDVNEYGSPEKCATQLRKLWKMPKGPIASMSELLESHGVTLVSFPFGTDRVDSKCIIAAQKYPLIVTNRTLLADRQRFTLAYHLGYLVMHWRQNVSFERDLSHEANLFAAEFLMPEKDIKEDLTELTFAKLADLKRKWKASMVSLLYRSQDIGLTTDNQKRYILQQFNLRGLRKREPPELDSPVEHYKLARDLITAYKSKQKLNILQMAEFFSLEEHDFLERYKF